MPTVSALKKLGQNDLLNNEKAALALTLTRVSKLIAKYNKGDICFGSIKCLNARSEFADVSFQ